MSRRLTTSLIAVVTLALAGCGASPRVASIAETVRTTAPAKSASAKARPTAPAPAARQASTPALPFMTQVGAHGATLAPDGGAMVFAAGRTGNRDLVIAGPDGSNPRALFESAYDDAHPAWSPSGAVVAFVRDAGAQGATLMRQPMAGGPAEVWLKSQEPIQDLAWLPGDRGVVFFAESGGTRVLYMLEGRGAPRAIWRGTGGAHPTVSADGRRIVFEAATAQGQALMALPLGGGEAQALKVEGTNPRQPSFSPSGMSLAYVADDGVYVARHDGSRATRLAAGKGFSAPAWHPRAPQLIVTGTHGQRVDLQAIALPQR